MDSIRFGTILRFPRAAGEPRRAYVWGHTLAFAPAGVYVYFLR